MNAIEKAQILRANGYTYHKRIDDGGDFWPFEWYLDAKRVAAGTKGAETTHMAYQHYLDAQEAQRAQAADDAAGKKAYEDVKAEVEHVPSIASPLTPDNAPKLPVSYKSLLQKIAELEDDVATAQEYINHNQLLVLKLGDCETMEQVKELLQNNHLRGLADFFDLPFEGNASALRAEIEALKAENLRLGFQLVAAHAYTDSLIATMQFAFDKLDSYIGLHYQFPKAQDAKELLAKTLLRHKLGNQPLHRAALGLGQDEPAAPTAQAASEVPAALEADEEVTLSESVIAELAPIWNAKRDGFDVHKINCTQAAIEVLKPTGGYIWKFEDEFDTPANRAAIAARREAIEAEQIKPL